MHHCGRLPRIQQRLACHDTAFVWSASANDVQKQLDVLDKALREFRASESEIKQLFAMILAVGNYLNADNAARGEAYALKLDVLSKLSALKATSSGNTLLHFIAHLADSPQNPNSAQLLGFSTQWLGVWAAGEVNWRQVQTDLNNLETQVRFMNTEFIRIKDTRENIGLDGELEDAKGPTTNPLYLRLDAFLTAAKPRLALMQQHRKSLDSDLGTLLARYGESMQDKDGACPVQKFFGVFGDFAKAYQHCVEDNQKVKKEKEKQRLLLEQQQQQQQQTNSPASASPSASNHSTSKQQNNLFGHFAQSQAQANVSDCVAEFKSKLAAQVLKKK